jgi:hypothetical protein
MSIISGYSSTLAYGMQQPTRAWDESLDPARVDRAADAELALGHHARAEFLAQRASEMREASR